MNVMVNHSLPINQWQPKEKPKREITYSLEMEERLAAKWANLSWDEYACLPGASRWIDPESDGDSKAAVLVAYRMAMRIEAVQNYIEPRKGKK